MCNGVRLRILTAALDMSFTHMPIALTFFVSNNHLHQLYFLIAKHCRLFDDLENQSLFVNSFSS